MIREAQVQDADDVLRLIRGLATYEKLEHEVVATREDIERSLFGPSPSAHCLLAEIDGVPRGLAIHFTNYSTLLGAPCSYLEDLFVEPDYRGRGLGRRLLASVAAWATERGHRRLDWSVLDWNAGAINFYRAIGAEPMDGWTVYRLSGPALARLAGNAE